MPYDDALSEPLTLRSMGSFHVGGRLVEVKDLPVIKREVGPGMPSMNVDPNGTYSTGQIYAQYFYPEPQRGAWPLLMIHGASATGAAFETRPDGAEGWLNWFLRRGWPVVVSDGVGRGRSGWNPFDSLTEGPPTVFPAEHLHGLLRIGEPGGSFSHDSSRHRDHAGTAFPIDAFDSFLARSVPFWPISDSMTDSYLQLLERVGPSILLCHSQGGHFAFRAACRRPDLVKAIVALEPGNMGEPGEYARLAPIPILVLFGDFVDEFPRMEGFRQTAKTAVAAIGAAGGSAELVNLPTIGIHGNSHAPMLDRNADDVAAVVQSWLARRGLYEG